MHRAYINLLYSPAFIDKFAIFSFDKWNRVADDINKGQKNSETFFEYIKRKTTFLDNL